MKDSSERGDNQSQDYEIEPTIVGGRPLGSASPRRKIPQGIEVLVKKASVDAGFRKLLLDKRAVAAADIGLDLSPAETAMLNTIPRSQIEQIIANVTVPDEHRRIFLGKIGAAMLAMLGIGLSSCARPVTGITADMYLPKGTAPDGRPWKSITSKSGHYDRPILKVEIDDHDTNSVSAKIRYDCPFDAGEIKLILGSDRVATAPQVTCLPERTAVSYGRGEVTISAHGKGGTSKGLLVGLVSTTDRCAKALPARLTVSDLQRVLPGFWPGEYVVDDCAFYRIAEFRKVWPS